MENEELLGLKRDFNAKIDQLERRHLSFKRTVCVVFNLIVPGLGFFVFGEGLLKGLVSFILFYGFVFLHIKYIVHNTDTRTAVMYFIPAIIIWIVSALMVGSLEE